MNEFSLAKIREENPIVEYLSSNNINYEYNYENKYMYVCPLHKDSKPSLVVYSDGEYDNFYCFGCKKSGDVIAMHAFLQGKSWGAAFKEFGGTVNVDNLQELNFLVDKLKRDSTKEISEDRKAKNFMSELSFLVSLMGARHIENTNYDKGEIEFLEKIYKVVDKVIKANNISELIKIYNFLTSNINDGPMPLMQRYNDWLQKKKVNIE